MKGLFQVVEKGIGVEVPVHILESYWSVKSNFWAEIYAKDCCCGVEWYASNHQGQALISWCRRRPLQKNKGRDTIIHLYHLSQILLFREADWWLHHTGRNLDWIKIRSTVSFLFFIEVWSQSSLHPMAAEDSVLFRFRNVLTIVIVYMSLFCVIFSS